MPDRCFIVCYDSPDDGRRSAISRLLTGWGERVQFSVFECALQSGELARMLRALQGLLDEEEDSVLVYQCAARGTPSHPAMGPLQPGKETATFWLA